MRMCHPAAICQVQKLCRGSCYRPVFETGEASSFPYSQGVDKEHAFPNVAALRPPRRATPL